MPKPVKKKKKFINKKTSTTYRLIPGYVEDEDDGPKVLQDPEEVDARKEEQRKFGIFYDDSYNYMKHLRSLAEQATLVESFRVGPDFDVQSNSSRLPLEPLEHFSTDVTEEDDIDPEILAALDDAPLVQISEEDLETEDVGHGLDLLDDDFITRAGGAVPVEENEEDTCEEEDGSDELSDEEEDEATGDDEDFFSSEDLDSDPEDDRLSYMHPSTGRGNVQDDIVEAQTALILKNFEEGLGFRCSNQILDEENGDMATAEDYENLKHILKGNQEKEIPWQEVLDDKSDRASVDVAKYGYERDDDDNEEEYEWRDVPARKPDFDCMSILSLNSNKHNLPTDLIPPKSESKRRPKTSEGTDNPSVPGISLGQIQAEMRLSQRVDRASTFRPPDETVEERKARKKAIKDERKERRQEKKANREVFAQEKEKMKVETAALSKSVRAVKIF